MRLGTGDRLLVTERDGEAGRVCRVLAVWGPDGTPPYLVLRYDTGTEELFTPTPDVVIRVLSDSEV
jgi:hypothetical protein